MRFSEARLQAVSSRNMYSEQGLEERISPPAGQVCHSLTVEWNWMPGSAQCQAASAIFSHSPRALIGTRRVGSTRPVRTHSPSATTWRMNSAVRRTELFEDWPLTVL
jgi:hypothetical protein